MPDDKTGSFIQRSVEGTGTVANTGVQLVWDFASNEVSKSQSARVKVFAVEMVYVAEGAFWVGDGRTNDISANFEDGTNGTPFLVTNENYEIILGGGGAGSLGNNNAVGMVTVTDDFNDTTNKTLPATFPKGFAAFYLMKTEASQRQYCDFLNTLTYTQQTNRFGIRFNVYRNYIKKTGDSPAFYGCDANNNAGPTNAVTDVTLLNETNDAEWVECNYISSDDIRAYLDWAALRPFTELEYEKACRGTLAPVSNEYAWGATNPAFNTSLTFSNTASETPNSGNINCTGCSPSAPYRVGCYATASSSSRTNSGAGYYGALDLSGSCVVWTPSVGLANGRVFTGAHGNGNLDASGNSDVSAWSVDSGYGQRGRCWCNAPPEPQLTFRGWADYYYDAYRNHICGLRGARTAPASLPSPGGSHDAYTYGGPGDGCAMDQSQDRSLDLPAGTIFKIY